MELTIDQTLQSAITAQNDGKYEKAEKLYQQVLQIQPTKVPLPLFMTCIFKLSMYSLNFSRRIEHRSMQSTGTNKCICSIIVFDTGIN